MTLGVEAFLMELHKSVDSPVRNRLIIFIIEVGPWLTINIIRFFTIS